jgi:hypothetical protein
LEPILSCRVETAYETGFKFSASHNDLSDSLTS